MVGTARSAAAARITLPGKGACVCREAWWLLSRVTHFRAGCRPVLDNNTHRWDVGFMGACQLKLNPRNVSCGHDATPFQAPCTGQDMMQGAVWSSIYDCHVQFQGYMALARSAHETNAIAPHLRPAHSS